MQVSTSYNSLNYEIELHDLNNLSTERLKQTLCQKTPSDLIGLFQASVRECCSRDSLRHKIFRRIRKQTLDLQQVNDLKALVLASFQDLADETEAGFKEDVIEFLKSTVRIDNAPALMAFALQNRSKALLDYIFDFLKIQSGASFECQNFGPLIIKFQGSDFQGIQNILRRLKNCLEYDRIRIEIKASAETYIGDLKEFVSENGSLIISSDYRALNLDEDALQFLLKNCQNLCHLFIKSKHINGYGVGLKELQYLSKLQCLHMIGCEALTKPPILSGCPNLQYINMSGCVALTNPPILSGCPNLQHIDMGGCVAMTNPPVLGCCPGLQSLNMSFCRSLKTPPDLRGCPSLQILNLSFCCVLASPPDLRGCPSLQILNLSGCQALTIAPDLSVNSSLQIIDMSACWFLVSPPDFSACLNLMKLNMIGCWSLKNAPDLSGCSRLQTLDMMACRGLTNPPDLSGCASLQSINMSGCEELTSAPNLTGCPELRTLNMSECQVLTIPPDLSGSHHLQTLNMSGCVVLTSAPDLRWCPSLQSLNMSECQVLTIPPDLSGSHHLQTLNMSGCVVLKNAPDLSVCLDLQILNMSNCGALTIPPDLSGRLSLKMLNISGCGALTIPPDLSGCLNLKMLNMSGCGALMIPPDLSGCLSLEILNMSGCIVLTSAPDLSACPSLQSLNISNCGVLTIPPDLSGCLSLQSLNMSNCLAMMNATDYSPVTLRRFFYIALKFPEVVKENDFTTLFRNHRAILDIIKLPSTFDEDLELKIVAFQTYLNGNSRLNDFLAEKVIALKYQDRAEQLPRLQFYAYTAGLITGSDLSEETLRCQFFAFERGGTSLGSKGNSVGQAIFDLILSYKFASHRYHFINNAVKMIAQNTPLDSITRWRNSWTRLVFLTLWDKVGLQSNNEIFVDIDNRKDLHDDIYLKILISFLIEISNVTPAEGFKIVYEMFSSKIASKMKTSKLIEEFQAYINISKIYGKTPFIECVSSGGDPTKYFAERFESTFGIQNVEDISNKYSQTFAGFRTPNALFTYWGSLKSLNSTRANSAVHETFREYLKAVLNGTFLKQRYDSRRSEHLKLIFSDRGGRRARKVWKANRNQESLDAIGIPAKIDYHQKIYEKIVTDGHLRLDDFPLLKAYFSSTQDSSEPSKMEIYQKVTVGLKDNFQKELIKLCEGKIDSNQFFKSKRVQAFINNELRTTEFFNDLESFKFTGTTHNSKFTIMESDDPEDLLKMGTEIKGSCLRVDGDPEFNRCLLSYLMNGEIKAIVVKSGSKFVARCILRIGWDPTTNRRVILQERVYNNNLGNSEIEKKINDWALDKARMMNCPLVIGEKGGLGKAYSGKILFRKGFAPFTYSDASGGVHSSGFETMNVRVIFDPADVEASTSAASSSSIDALTRL